MGHPDLSWQPTLEARRSMLFLPDLAALHYEVHFFQLGHVVERASGDGDDVGVFTRSDRADLVLPSEKFGGPHGCGAKRLRWRHAEFHHCLELHGRINVPGEAADVRSERDL